MAPFRPTGVAANRLICLLVGLESNAWPRWDPAPSRGFRRCDEQQSYAIPALARRHLAADSAIRRSWGLSVSAIRRDANPLRVTEEANQVARARGERVDGCWRLGTRHGSRRCPSSVLEDDEEFPDTYLRRGCTWSRSVATPSGACILPQGSPLVVDENSSRGLPLARHGGVRASRSQARSRADGRAAEAMLPSVASGTHAAVLCARTSAQARPVRPHRKRVGGIIASHSVGPGFVAVALCLLPRPSSAPSPRMVCSTVSRAERFTSKEGDDARAILNGTA